MDAIAPELEPISGVTLAAFVTVSRGLSQYQFDPDHATRVAAAHGIDDRDWVAAAAGWTDRLRTNPVVVAEFQRLYHDQNGRQ